MINNETIPEAEIVEQPIEPTNADLLSALEAPTETKTPSNTNSDGWSFDVEPETTTVVEPQPTNTEPETSNPKTQTTATAQTSGLSKTEINANAKLNVGFIDFTQQNVLRFFLNKKFEKKYTEQELELIKTDLVYKPKVQLTEAEQVLKAKHKTLENKKKRKADIIPFEDLEKKQLEKIVADYIEATGQSMPPWLTAVLAVGQIMLKRVEVFTED